MSAIPIALSRAAPGDRLRDLGLFSILVLWLAYTRIFWALQAAHVAMPPCPFYYLTGHPCPFCGGTRSFAYMWRGDVVDAVRLYPLGPALFAGTFVGAAGLAAGAVTGRTWTPRFSTAQWRVLGVGVLSAVLMSWALKVFVLGN
ncbi:MAG TPA: DUF2752 domain-containing protein [Candidatus Baltobacterales bacterium]|nr:DUF2752 domain-containing protein [Candidatus Baltobacterales bacterium]